MTRLRAVALDELSSAQIQIRVDRPHPGSRCSTCSSEVEQTSDGIGNVRSLGRGGARLTEKILANDDGRHWAFRVETAPFPTASQLRDPNGCR